MTMGCHSSCGVFLLSSLDTMLAPQKQEQGSAVTETAERWKNRWRARTGEEREERGGTGGVPPPHTALRKTTSTL